MKSKIIIPALLITMAAGFTACQKDSTTGNSILEFKLQALNKSYSLPVKATGTKSTAATSAAITWDTAHMVVSKLEYEAQMKTAASNRDSIEISFEWKGPQLVNLLDASTILGSYTLLPGNYDEIELKVEGLKKDANGKPVFYLSGSYTNSAGSIMPISFKVYEDVLFKTEKDNIDVAADNSVFTSTIMLYLDQLLIGIEPIVLDNATLTNGALIISADSNSQIYQVIMMNLHKDHHSEHKHHHDND